MLVPGMHEPHAVVLGHGVRPMHVGVAHQGEHGVDPFGDERLGKDFVDWQLHRADPCSCPREHTTRLALSSTGNEA